MICLKDVEYIPYPRHLLQSIDTRMSFDKLELIALSSPLSGSIISHYIYALSTYLMARAYLYAHYCVYMFALYRRYRSGRRQNLLSRFTRKTFCIGI